MKSPADLEKAFLDAIADNPEEDTPRLVFSDWLMEQGDPHGELIRAQVELARQEEDIPQRKELEQLEKELLDAHEKRWLNHPPAGLVVVFERGLLVVETSRWGKPEARWAERQSGWIGRLALLDMSDTDLELLAAGEAIRRVPIVEIVSGSITDDGLAWVGRMTGLRRLVLANLGVGRAGLPHLAELPSLRELALILLPTDEATLECVSNFTELRVLEVEGRATPLSGIGCSRLARLKRLRRLRLVNVPLTDDELEAFADLDDLTALDVSGTEITNVGLMRLGRLTRFQELNLARTWLTDAVMPVLAASTGLRMLNLSFPGLTDDGLDALAELNGLLGLDLSGTPITDIGLSVLESLTVLRKLQLSRTRVTDGIVDLLCGLHRLDTLGLASTALTDDGLLRLAELPLLRQLDVRGTAVTEEGVAELQESLPQCQIASGKDAEVPRSPFGFPGLFGR